MARKVIRQLADKNASLLNLVLLFLLVLSTFLFVWATLTQKFDLRKYAATPGAVTKPASYIWTIPITDSAFYLQADEIYFYANGVRFTPELHPDLKVTSSNPNYLKMLVSWFDPYGYGAMKMELVMTKGATNWTLYQINTILRPNSYLWIYYSPNITANIGSPITGDKDFGPPIGGGFKTDKIHFTNLKLYAFTNPPPVACGGLNAWCGAGGFTGPLPPCCAGYTCSSLRIGQCKPR